MALAARPREYQKMELRRPARLTTLGPMKGYGQFCPVAKAAEIVAERWTPLVLRELLCGSRRFSDLHRGVPLMSPTLLAQRLEQLEDAGIVRSVPRPHGRGCEYELTAASGVSGGPALRSAATTWTRGFSCGTSTAVSTWTRCRPNGSSSASTSAARRPPCGARGRGGSCSPGRRSISV